MQKLPIGIKNNLKERSIKLGTVVNSVAIWHHENPDFVKNLRRIEQNSKRYSQQYKQTARNKSLKQYKNALRLAEAKQEWEKGNPSLLMKYYRNLKNKASKTNNIFIL